MADESDDEAETTPAQPVADDAADGPAIEVPSSPPDPETNDHVLGHEDLVYPTISFDDGDATWRTGFELSRSVDDGAIGRLLEALDGAVTSHDLAIEGAGTRVTFGVRPDDVTVDYDPEGDRRGTLDVTLSLDTVVVRAEDAAARPTGARGDRGFIPLGMLTGERAAGAYRCYNWVDDPGVDDGTGTDRE